MAVEYFYIENRTPPSDNQGPDQVQFDFSTFATPPSPLTDIKNPIFNFPTTFFSKFQNIPTTQLAQHVPFISLKAVDQNGEVIEDYDLKFFHKTLDFDELKKTDSVNADRPIMSLKDATIKSTEASGPYAYVQVTLNIKIHRQDAFGKSMLALIMPGFKLLLEYGWNGPNDFLAQKESLFFNVATYNIHLTNDNQADLTIEGFAQNTFLTSIYVGDTGIGPGEDSNKITNVGEEAGIEFRYDRMVDQIDYINEIKQSDNKKNNIKIFDFQGQTSIPSFDAIRGNIRKTFATKKEELRGKTTSIGDKLYVTVHDIIDVFLNETLSTIQTKFLSTNLRIIYGTANEYSGDGKATLAPCIANFSIDWEKFDNVLKKHYASFGVPTINALISDIILSEFVNKPEYWKEQLGDDIKDSETPEFIMYFTNHRIGTKHYTDMYIVDPKRNIPLTSVVLRQLNKENASQKEIEAAIVGDPQRIPILKVGHANSFVKNINLSYVNDAAVKTYFIERSMQTTISNTREFKIPLNQTITKPNSYTPLHLPLEGEVNTVGHIEWKPYRFFYLSSGNPLIDGVYAILERTHTISKESFTSNLKIRFN